MVERRYRKGRMIPNMRDERDGRGCRGDKY